MSGTLVDARGLRCPLPVIRLAMAAKGLPPGSELTVLSTDPAARLDVPAWCRMRGHEHVTTREHTTTHEHRADGTDSAGDDWAGWSITVHLG